MAPVQQLYDSYFRPLNPVWRLDSRSVNRLIGINTIPAIVFAGIIVHLLLAYIFDPTELAYADQVGGPGELWERLDRVARTATGALLPVAVAVIFIGTLHEWNRAEGTWMLLFGFILAALAVLFGSLVTLLIVATEDTKVIIDFRAGTWGEVAPQFGFLSIGYIFFGYRTLVQTTPKVALRRYRRRRVPG
jgi:hypothetical protein